MHSQTVGTQKLCGFLLCPDTSTSDNKCSFASNSANSFEVVGTLNQIILFLHDIITGGGDTLKFFSCTLALVLVIYITLSLALMLVFFFEELH